jgi:endoglucanase
MGVGSYEPPTQLLAGPVDIERVQPLRRTLTLVAFLVGLLIPASAQADLPLLSGFRLSSALLFVHENAGYATITVTRGDTIFGGEVHYGDWHLTAAPGTDYTTTSGVLHFNSGQATASFEIPIIDQGIVGPPRTLTVGLYGASQPTGLGLISSAVLTIIDDDPLTSTKITGNPLALGQPPAAATGTATGPNSDPLAGAKFFVDRLDGPAMSAELALAGSDPADAATLNVITSQPQTQRFGAWDGANPAEDVSRFLERAASEEPGRVPMISTYRIVDGHCGSYTPPPSSIAAYENWVNGLAYGIGQYRAVVFLEMDSLITSGCLTKRGVQIRMNELKYATTVLSKLPRVVVYLDAGAADALPAWRAAQLLEQAGVRKIQGFFLNSTHFDWTLSEIHYGERISKLTGGKHFVVNTAVNGQGPLVPRDRAHTGNEVLCNPPNRGLGPRPTADTGYPNVDAFAWLGNPGRSGGSCVPGAPATGVFWLAQALSLIRHANFSVR